MAWRLARSLDVLRSQVNAVAPNRDKTSDGTIGDIAHRTRASDHNPNAAGVVTAMDIDHDPAHGMDTYVLAETLRANKDPRIEYVISNGKIFNSRVSPWQWRAYNGSNKHDRHIHISVHNESNLYDIKTAWELGSPTVALTPGRFTGITATVFGGPRDRQPVAYSDVAPGWDDRPGCALPYRYPPGKRPIVRVTYKGKSVDCPIVDVGPWNTNDQDYVLRGHRPQAETGTDTRGRRTNLAGIDLTPAAAIAIGLNGKGKVDVEWPVEAVPAPAQPPLKPATPVTPQPPPQGWWASLKKLLGW